MPLTLVRPTMVLARPILDRDGRVAVGAGTVLGPRVLQVLRRLAIQSVPVVPCEDLAAWEQLGDEGEAEAAVLARFAREPATPAMVALRDAVVRCLRRRASDAAELSGALAGPGREGDDASGEGAAGESAP